MAEEIQPHNTLLRELFTSQNLQFGKNIVNHAGAEIETVHELGQLYQDMQQQLATFNGVFLRSLKMFETEEVQAKDSGRDFYVNALTSRIASLSSYPITAEGKAEAARMKFIIDTYKHAARKEYESETALISNMIVEFRKYDALLVKYGVKDIIDALEVANDAFDNIYNARLDARLQQQQEGKMVDLRRAFNKSFDNLCKAITGMMMLPFSDEVKEKLTHIIGLINANIDQYSEIYHRHAGIVAKHRKKDGDKNDGDNNAPGTQKPDNTNPPAPNTPPQNPDATLPPAPDTPPQNPSNTPPPVNPDELNPPSVGER
ncbi:MAG: DUF6261 family protein [Tannerellaceae bacterium]|jgi:hypothetical protein|nr:DUF6261 family protein [Tannerellaceae bacterium]